MSDDNEVILDETPALITKQAGQGAAKPKNPFDSYRIPMYDTPEDYEVANPQSAKNTGASSKAQSMIDFAKKFVGTPYVWGGAGPLGFDCSGLTQYVFRQAGIELPRVSYQQGQGGKAVSKDDWQPGDLLFWDTSSRNNGADHVAIYLGNGMMLAAPKPGDKVKIQAVYGTPWARRYL